MPTFWQDVRYGIRLLIKDKWFTLMAVIALGLGIGVNNTVFTFVNAVLIRGLPFEESDRIMYVDMKHLTRDQNRAVSYPDYLEWKNQTKTFSELGAFTGAIMNVSDEGRPPERIPGNMVSANTFRILRQAPLLGRDFRPDDDRKGAEPVAIIGYGVWKTRYGGDANILGRVIKVNDLQATIVGVMPEGMKFPVNADMWMPFIPNADQETRKSRPLAIFGRLAPGATRAQAQAELSAISASLAQQFPDTNKDFGAAIKTFNDQFNGGPIRLVFLTLMGAVGFVLLIACANVANLLLARSAQRAREVAVRVSLGATRRRVIRQLLVESIMLGVISGVAGLGLSYVGVSLFDRAVADVGKPYWIQFTMDARVFSFLAFACLATSIIFGLVPALHASKTNVNELLKEGGRTGSSARARRMSSSLIVVEIVLTLVLLSGGGFMMRSFLILYTLDLGVDTDHLLSMNLVLPERKYPTPEQRLAFQDRLLERLNAVSGVAAATVASNTPMGGSARQTLEIDGVTMPQGERASDVSVVRIGDRYFDTLGLTLPQGRAPGPGDGRKGSEATVVNARFGARFLPGEQLIGRRIRTKVGENKPGPWMTIVGVSPNVRQSSQQDPDPDAVIYVPYRQEPASGMLVLVRSRGEPSALVSQIRDEVRAVDPDQPVFNVRTMNESLAQARFPYRVFGGLFVIFAIIALVLAAVGLYAVTAYSVAQRTQEIGIRMALGAQPGQVSWSILRGGLLRLLMGAAVGLPGAYGVGRLLSGLLVQTTPYDPLTLGLITGILALVSIVACLLPARRATRLDPVSALRAE